MTNLPMLNVFVDDRHKREGKSIQYPFGLMAGNSKLGTLQVTDSMTSLHDSNYYYLCQILFTRISLENSRIEN